jgi:hypothetical protein
MGVVLGLNNVLEPKADAALVGVANKREVPRGGVPGRVACSADRGI